MTFDTWSLVPISSYIACSHFDFVVGKSGSDVIESKPNVARWFKDVSSRDS